MFAAEVESVHKYFLQINHKHIMCCVYTTAKYMLIYARVDDRMTHKQQCPIMRIYAFSNRYENQTNNCAGRRTSRRVQMQSAIYIIKRIKINKIKSYLKNDRSYIKSFFLFLNHKQSIHFRIGNK